MVFVKEKNRPHFENIRDLIQGGSRDPVFGPFVFLNLLVAHTQTESQFASSFEASSLCASPV